eukprot:Selendium_serpulae@DN5548_c0_g1_i1.p2
MNYSLTDPSDLSEGLVSETDDCSCAPRSTVWEAAGVLAELSRTLSRQQTLLRDLPSAVKAEAEKVQQEIGERREELKKRTQRLWRKSRRADIRRRSHKLTFVGVMLNVILTSFWVGHHPQSYYIFHTIKTIFMVLARFIVYRWQKNHYYMLDYCYYANLLLLLYLWVLPLNATLWKALFSSSGILAISIPLFRSGLIPHSLDRVTSVEIHFSPLLVFWTLRWYPPTGDRFVDFASIAEKTSFSNGLWLEGYCAAFTLYFLWAAIYYTTIFIISATRIKKKGNMTLYNYVAFEKGVLAKFPEPWQSRGPYIFIFVHFVLFTVGCAVVSQQDRVYWFHTATLLLSLLPSLWFGATFYIDYFSRTYEEQLKLAESVAMAKDDAKLAENPHKIE